MRDETLAFTPRFGSTAPVSSTMTSSENGCSLSLTTKGALMIFSRWRSTSAGLITFPSLSTTSRPGVSNRKRWSRGKCLLPWKCRKISWWPWFSTDTSLRQILQKNDWVLSQHLWAQSQRIAQRHSLPKLFSFSTSSWNVTCAVAHQHHSHHHLCQWYRPTEEEHGMATVPPAPVHSKPHLILWTTSLRAQCGQKGEPWECEENYAALQNTKERKHYVLEKKQ